MKSIFLRNFMANALLVFVSFLIIALSFIGIGRSYVISESRENMVNTANEVGRMASAVVHGDSLSGWMLSMSISSIAKATGDHIFITDASGTVLSCSDRAPVCEHLGLENEKPDLTEWTDMVHRQEHAETPLKIAIVGKYAALPDAYLSVMEAVRHAAFAQGCKADIKLINSAGPFPAGGEFERGWANAKKNGSNLVDEHYYTSPEWMLANTDRYDDYAETPKVFLGEYASWGNTYYNALCEAAYMTSLENHADKVGLVCYAPLFANAIVRADGSSSYTLKSSTTIFITFVVS